MERLTRVQKSLGWASRVWQLVSMRNKEGALKSGVYLCPSSSASNTLNRSGNSMHKLTCINGEVNHQQLVFSEKKQAVLNLLEAGNTVVVIEHNLDIIAEADWLLDLGPEGGTGGGKLVIEGTPEQVMKVRSKSHTGEVLYEFMHRA
jgi:hypothetical protein